MRSARLTTTMATRGTTTSSGRITPRPTGAPPALRQVSRGDPVLALGIRAVIVRCTRSPYFMGVGISTIRGGVTSMRDIHSERRSRKTTEATGTGEALRCTRALPTFFSCVVSLRRPRGHRNRNRGCRDPATPLASAAGPCPSSPPPDNMIMSNIFTFFLLTSPFPQRYWTSFHWPAPQSGSPPGSSCTYKVFSFLCPRFRGHEIGHFIELLRGPPGARRGRDAGGRPRDSRGKTPEGVAHGATCVP